MTPHRRWRIRLTAAAEMDFRNILRWTFELFRVPPKLLQKYPLRSYLVDEPQAVVIAAALLNPLGRPRSGTLRGPVVP